MFNVLWTTKVMNKVSEAHLEPSKGSTMELLCENSKPLKAVNCLPKKVLS